MRAFKLIQISIILAIITSFSADVFGQCKAFTKKSCLPKLEPYIHNGQLNSVMLYPGENATLMQTFYSGQDYRMLVCNEVEEMGTQAVFIISDSDGNELYSSENTDGVWDFNVQSTQELQIEVKVPRVMRKGVPITDGCVAILVGFK